MKKWLVAAAIAISTLVGAVIPHAFQGFVLLHAQQDPAKITVYITKTGEKYHRDGCRYLSRSKIASTLKQAIARGLGPCSVCKPPTAR